MPSSDLVQTATESSALMPPPPPPKRIKRPAKVLDEDEYTDALSEIIARDFFPGLLLTQAQDEYFTALQSEDSAWVTEAGANLQRVMTPGPHTRSRQARIARNTRFNTPVPGVATPKNLGTPGATPRGSRGEQTPNERANRSGNASEAKAPEIDTSNLSLSAFQAKYTSEDNESFNALLDKQNTKRRNKHAYLWTPDQRIPSARQIAHRDRESKLLKQHADELAQGNDQALVPIAVGADTSRPARPDSWKIKDPVNGLMFTPPSMDDEAPGLETVASANEKASRAGPKAVNHAATRLPAPPPPPVPASPSLSSIQSAIAGRPRLSASEASDTGGSETPRINGYAFVDEEEPQTRNPGEQEIHEEPSYRDLLAGQAGDGTPNPFRIGEKRRREALHHRLVEREARKKRDKEKEKDGNRERGGGGVDVPRFASSPMILKRPVGTETGVKGKGQTQAGGLTPAARRLLERVGGATPGRVTPGNGSMLRDMWTPTGTTTPRKRAAGKLGL